MAKDQFGGADYIYDTAVPNGDGTGYLNIVKKYNNCNVEVLFSKTIASGELVKIIFSNQ